MRFEIIRKRYTCRSRESNNRKDALKIFIKRLNFAIANECHDRLAKVKQAKFPIETCAINRHAFSQQGYVLA